jgi:hypothetical protein
MDDLSDEHKIEKKSLHLWGLWFFCVKNIFEKEYLLQIPLFFLGQKNHHQKITTNSLQYERVRNSFYFHILNIAKFG